MPQKILALQPGAPAKFFAGVQRMAHSSNFLVTVHAY